MAHGADTWERFARQDAETYIMARIGGTPGGADLKRFFESGRRQAAWMLDEVAELLPGRDLAIEIGCGVGRLLIPMAGRFARVVGVDVAPTMLAKLADNCARFGAANVQGALVDEPWDRPGQADFIYSWLVFQHVADFRTIANLLRRIARALRPGGAALFQFDTRPRTLLYRLRNAVPDPLLPRTWRRGIRRIRRPARRIAELIDGAGLQRVHDRAAGTEQHVFILRRGSEPASTAATRPDAGSSREGAAPGGGG